VTSVDFLRRPSRSRHTTNSAVLVKELLSVPSDNAAKASVYARQMEKERLIDGEVTRMLEAGEFTAEEWRLVCALLYQITGNVFSFVSSARYGGEAARIQA
jgi:hypothetical protein